MALRVEFVLSDYALRSGAVISAAREAFGESVARYANCSRQVRVSCDSDQMLKFLVLRNRYGGNNGWKELHVELFETPSRREEEIFLDVRKK